MESYLTVKEKASAEYTEKRSRFLAVLVPCETEESAVSFIEEIRKTCWDARHHVYAYITNHGAVTRFSDDGEPHGTAGKPVLEVLSGSGLTNVCLVVTRYFGGVLLGTGGLVRAYSKAAKDAVNAAEILEMVPCRIFSTRCEYAQHAKLLSLLEKAGAAVENTVFDEKITLTYTLQEKQAEDFLLLLKEIFSGGLRAVELGTRLCGRSKGQ